MADNTAQVRFFEARGLGEPAQPSLWVKIEGIAKPFAVMQYSATFAKSEIPTATCVLGTGKSLSDNSKVAVPEELVENLDGAVLTKAKVFLKFGPESQWTPGPASPKWPNEPECIFEGYYAGVSYNRVGPQIQMSIALVHRLVDLTFGSLMSAWQHPSNTVNLLGPAVSPLLGGKEGDCHTPNAGGTGAWTSASFLKPAIEDEDDFGEALLQTCLCMTAQGVFRMNCAKQDLPEQPNTSAAEVFKAIESKTGSFRDPLSTYSFKTAIANYVGDLTDDSQGLTYWDFLIGKVFPDFAMAMIPLPSKQSSPDKAYAYIVADTPGLNKEYMTLYLGDYTNFNLKAKMWKPLYAVGVLSAGDDISGTELNSNKSKPIKGGLCIGGVFPDPGDLGDQLGQYLLVHQPEWLNKINFASGAMREFGNTDEAAHDAVAGDENFTPPDDDKQPAGLNENRNTVLDMVAKMYYVHNAINGRGGTFDSKLRFDISPGTILKLSNKPEIPQKNPYKELPGTVFVQVSRVTHNINAESSMAKTSFDCVHLRTEKENNKGQPKGRFSVAEHVFFTGEISEAAPAGKSYSGAPMIEAWKFMPAVPDVGDVLGDLNPGAVAGIA